MKGDFSKETFDAGKHFHDVLMQQGRVLLDQEWNEQSAIAAYRTETDVKDIVGDSGGNLLTAGFKLVPVVTAGSPPSSPPTTHASLTITKGRYFVDGILVENDAGVSFEDQPHYAATPLPGAGTFVFYLDVWLRHITALENASIREVALGGPDTATRTQTIWQVKYVATNADQAQCSRGMPTAVTASSTGKLSARSEAGTTTEDPCGLTTSGGYRRLENQLYRVEIHKGADNRANATFKWSRDNGSVLTKCEKQDAVNKKNITVSSAGPDDLLGFKSGNLIEIIDNDHDLLGTPGKLATLVTVNGNLFTIDQIINIDFSKNPRIRRWDAAKELTLNTTNTWLPLEDGVEVKFEEGSFKTGDYWLVPARTAIADVEWPYAVPQPPKGIVHHYAPLAIASFDEGAGWNIISDCRDLFPPLNDLTALTYVGGDGQQAMPGQSLPDTLKVGVTNGGFAVSGATVQFTIVLGGGSLIPADGKVKTNVNGIAECRWTLGSDTSDLELQVNATLVDDAGIPVTYRLPILFNASFSIASNVYYDGGDCTNWPGGPPTNVADALTSLCKRTSGGNEGKRKCSFTVGKGGDFDNIKEAFDKLQKESEICLCLLPGTHNLEEISLGGDDKELIKLTGCYASINLQGKLFVIVAKKIVIHGIGIDVDLNFKTARIILMSTETQVDQCVFTCFDNEVYQQNAFVAVMPMFPRNKQGTPTLQWTNNQMYIGEKHEGIALGIMPSVSGWVEKSIITGMIILQYEEGESNLVWDERTEKKLKDITANITASGQMKIHGNILSNIRTNGIYTIEKQMAYRSIMISENSFQKVIVKNDNDIGNNLLAGSVSLINNHFLFKDKRNQVVVFGGKAVVMGNIAEEKNTQIRVIADDKIGVQPNLNIADVQ